MQYYFTIMYIFWHKKICGQLCVSAGGYIIIAFTMTNMSSAHINTMGMA